MPATLSLLVAVIQPRMPVEEWVSMTDGPISSSRTARALVSTCSLSGALNSGYWMRRNWSSGVPGAHRDADPGRLGRLYPAELDPDNVGDLLTLDSRRINVLRSQLFAEAINRHGGDAEVLILPEIGILGNTHFPMSDLNNDEIADLLSEFPRREGPRRARPEAPQARQTSTMTGT